MDLELFKNTFKMPDDSIKWEKYIEYFTKSIDIEEFRKNKLIANYRFLKQEFGRDYLKRRRQGINLIKDWVRNLEHNSSEIEWLSNALRYFKQNDCNYEVLKGRLKSDKNCNIQGFPFLLAGDSLQKVGFTVKFEPPIDYKKNPDIEIINPKTNEILYAEVTKVDDSSPRLDSKSTYRLISDLFLFSPPNIPFVGKIYRNISIEEFEPLKELILLKKTVAVRDNSIKEIKLIETKGIIHCMVSPWEKRDELKAWAAKNKYKDIGRNFGHIDSIPIDFDDTDRIIKKITKKIEQLPPEYPGIFYFNVNPLYFKWGMYRGHEHNIRKIKETISQYPNLYGVCLISHIGDTAKPGVISNEFFYLQKKQVHGNIEQEVWFLFNDYFKHKLSRDSKKRISQSFPLIYD